MAEELICTITTDPMTFTLTIAGLTVSGLQIESRWNGLAKYSDPHDRSRWVIVSEGLNAPMTELLRLAFPIGKTFSTVEQPVVSLSPVLWRDYQAHVPPGKEAPAPEVKQSGTPAL